MTRAEGPVFENADDPYTVRTHFDAEDNFHIVVSADVLAGGDTDEVRAAAQLRADLLRDHLLSMVRHPETKVPRPPSINEGDES